MTNIKKVLESLRAFLTSGLALVVAILTAFFPSKTSLGKKLNEWIDWLNNV